MKPVPAPSPVSSKNKTGQHNVAVEPDKNKLKKTMIMNVNTKRRLLIIACIVAAAALNLEEWLNVSIGEQKAVNSTAFDREDTVRRHQAPSFVLDKATANDRSKDVLTLHPGDLPGYTGWARPAHSDVDKYEIRSISQSQRRTQGDARPVVTCTVTVACDDCSHGGALWDSRAYGPSVVAGRTRDYGNGMYDIEFSLWDAGVYTLEVVLAFSSPPPMDSFPVKEQPIYEGFQLRGFPRMIQVDLNERTTDSTTKTVSVSRSSGPRRCGFEDLIQSSNGFSSELGRWKVVESVRNRERRGNLTTMQRVSVRGYQSGVNSLGFRMDYVPTRCRLASKAQTINALRQQSKKINMIFIGDSNMRLQYNLFNELNPTGSNVSSHFLSLNEGLVSRFNETLIALEELRSLPNTFVLFNSGLHDVAQLCSKRFIDKRSTYITQSEEEFQCHEQYRKSLSKFASILRKFPSELTVFETTTAGWPKWGNFGFAWPPWRGQPLPLDSHYVDYFNGIAVEVVSELDIPVVDGFWLTRARPDHREVSHENDIGKHLVHAGPEVYTVLLREWIALVEDKVNGV